MLTVEERSILASKTPEEKTAIVRAWINLHYDRQGFAAGDPYRSTVAVNGLIHNYLKQDFFMVERIKDHAVLVAKGLTDLRRRKIDEECEEASTAREEADFGQALDDSMT